jgi:hypothetical protein
MKRTTHRESCVRGKDSATGHGCSPGTYNRGDAHAHLPPKLQHPERPAKPAKPLSAADSKALVAGRKVAVRSVAASHISYDAKNHVFSVHLKPDADHAAAIVKLVRHLTTD